MTSTTERIAVLGTGLIGTSIAMAAARVGCTVSGWDVEDAVAARAGERAMFEPSSSLEAAVDRADVVVISTPIAAIADLLGRTLEAAPTAVVTDAASIKDAVAGITLPPSDAARFVPGHPMGGSERSGPEHASASLVDDIMWVLTPTPVSDPAQVERLAGWITRIGARVVQMTPQRHDRLVAFVSHLPQVASTALMALAATEESDEPEILMLAAGGFRDLTRLASSDPALWSEILRANAGPITGALDLYIDRLTSLRRTIAEADADAIERVFLFAKTARLKLAAKPKVRAGVAVLQVPIPDQPGALARLTAALGTVEVNIEDLQLVHSPEGGRGTVHLTIAAADAESASTILTGADFDPIRLA
ncbi:MAG: prephenate dehydrogenase [Actinomycetota bacterium]